MQPSVRCCKMVDAEVLSSLIGDLYDAALDPALWSPVLANVARFAGGFSCAMAVKDACSKQGSFVCDDGVITPHYRQLYFERYIKLDPFTAAQCFAPICEPTSSADALPFDEYCKTRFYKEWAKPQGIIDCVVVALDKSATSAALCLVFRHERDGIVDNATRARMRLIAPHVRRSVLIAKLMELKTVEAATFAETFDGLSAAMFLVDPNGYIAHANAAGHDMLHTDDFLKRLSGQLVASDPAADQLLRDSFGTNEVGIDRKGIAVNLVAHDGTHHVAHVLPLRSGARRQIGKSYAASAAVFVQKASLDVPSPHELIVKAYQLTPTELRVLLGIVEIGGVPEVAAAFGVSAETVKTHLARLYRKTGTTRQADLVKLVAGFCGPLRRS
jgi:DNA-binding CsgD family transcriptional regulator/PAS domain-containing protein